MNAAERNKMWAKVFQAVAQGAHRAEVIRIAKASHSKFATEDVAEWFDARTAKQRRESALRQLAAINMPQAEIDREFCF